MRIHHVAIIVSDIERSIDFYQKVLGFKLIRKVFREQRKSFKVDLECGHVAIELFTFPNSPQRPSYTEAQGLRHLAFGVDNLDEQHHKISSLTKNVEAIRVDEYTGKKFFFFPDPDGLPIEIYEN